ncbi:hypothetical protein C0J52_06293 [Blattella germanica]|nr:hypothetical protein C0J52_06293 [Blattella germanica]
MAALLLKTFFLLISLQLSLSRDCKHAVAMTTENAAAIFTGKVDSLTSSESGDVTAVIQVKRILKKSPKLKMLSAGDKVRVRVLKGNRSVGRPGKGLETLVDAEVPDDVLKCLCGEWYGFSVDRGNGFLRKLRLRDTKMFLVKKRMDASLELFTPPLPLKLDLLERVSIAIKARVKEAYFSREWSEESLNGPFCVC